MGRQSIALKLGLNVTIDDDGKRGFKLTVTDDEGIVVREPTWHVMQDAAKTAVSHFARKQYPDMVAAPVLRSKKVDLFASEADRLNVKAEKLWADAKQSRVKADRLEEQAKGLEKAAAILNELL